MPLPKGIIYTRVSSNRQIENTSLEEQARVCNEFAKRKNIVVSKIFREEGESAKFTDRTQLKLALNYCAEKSNHTDYFIVYKYDRFSRSVENHHAIKALLSKAGVRLLSATEQTEENPSGNLMENVLASFAQFDKEQRAERSISGMKATMLVKGRHPFRTPWGYIKDHSYKGKDICPVIPDPNIFEYLRETWIKFLSRQHTIKELAKWLDSKGVKSPEGKKVIPQTIDRMFRNPFYAGILTSAGLGVTTETSEHIPMVTITQFYMVQQILKKRSSVGNKEYWDINPDFILNKLLKCSVCGKPLTGSWAKRQYDLGYYKCYNNNCPSKGINKNTAIKAFLSLLDKITPSKELTNLYNAIVIEKMNEKNKEKQVIQKALEAEISKLKSKSENITNLLEEGIYSPEKYTERISTVDTELTIKTLQLSETNIDIYDYETCISYSLRFISKLPTFWNDLTPLHKSQLQQVLFPEGIVYENGRVTTKHLTFIYKGFSDERYIEKTFGDPGGVRTRDLLDENQMS